jgi:Protein of unknown function (DUF1353)
MERRRIEFANQLFLGGYIGVTHMQDKITFMQAALQKGAKRFGQPVPIVPFANWDYYYTNDSLEWRADGDDAVDLKDVLVPKGFVTDLASIPPVFWSMLPPTGQYTYPAIVHDYLYWFQPVDRDTADEILKLAMQDVVVPATSAAVTYKAVRVGGGSSWAKNEELRRKGDKRILKSFPTDMQTTWDVWKAKKDVFA